MGQNTLGLATSNMPYPFHLHSPIHLWYTFYLTDSNIWPSFSCSSSSNNCTYQNKYLSRTEIFPLGSILWCMIHPSAGWKCQLEQVPGHPPPLSSLVTETFRKLRKCKLYIVNLYVKMVHQDLYQYLHQVPEIKIKMLSTVFRCPFESQGRK